LSYNLDRNAAAFLHPIHNSLLPVRIRSFAACALFVALIEIANTTAYAQHEVEFIVRLRDGADAKSVLEALRLTVAPAVSMRSPFARPTGASLQRRSAFRLDAYVVIRVPAVTTTRIREVVQSMPNVAEVLSNHHYRLTQTPDDSLYSDQYALTRIEAMAAWQRTVGDSSVRVAFIDTGVDYEHPDLHDAFDVNAAEDLNRNGRFDPWLSTESRGGVTGDLDGLDADHNGFVDDVIGYDFVDQVVPNIGDWSGRDADPWDDNGHGTNVGGVVAARLNNRVGIAGVAPGARAVVLRAFDAAGNGEDDDIAAATVYAVERGVRVINMSFGDYYDSPLLHDAIRYAHAHGVIVVASAGNEATSDLHYPSSFPEVTSVGSTTRDDNLSSFSSFGSQISLTAPGSDIRTLKAGGGYTRASGTSLSAPYVSGVAALIVSIHPAWGPDEVRAALELTADDRGRPGWDIYFGAGRLNARRALDYPGPAEVAIVAPEFNGGYANAGELTVVGSAMSPLLSHWSLDVGSGDSPTEWRPIVDRQEEGRVRDVLGILDLGALLPAPHTLRLRLEETNGRVTERRLRFIVGAARPVVMRVDTADIWRFDRRAFYVEVETDQPAHLTMHLRPVGNSSSWTAIALEPDRAGIRRINRLIVTDNEMAAGLPHEYYLVLSNPAGDTVMIGSPEIPLRHVRLAGGFATVGFDARSFELPYGYTQNDVRPIVNAEPTIAINRFTPDGDFGPLELYSFDGREFRARDSVDIPWAPRGFGDVDGDGLIELLGQAFGSGIVYGQRDRGMSPLASIRYIDTSSDGFYAARLVDLDGDGRDEVIARTSNLGTPEYYVARIVDGRLQRVATLADTTTPARGDAQNFLGPPVVAVADFDGDGRRDVLFGDEDSDFILHRNLGDLRFASVWSVENEGNGGGEFVASGDLDGDGRAEAVVAFHARLAVFAGEEYPPPLWTVQVYSFSATGAATLTWQDRFAYVRPTNVLRSGIEVGDLDGLRGDEIVLGLFPNAYVLRWDSASSRPVPLWWTGGAIGNRPIIADIDGNGRNELGIGDGRSISFFEMTDHALAMQAPSAIRAWGVNDSSAIVEWGAVEGADIYVVYRAESKTGSGALAFDSIATVSGQRLVDTGIGIVSGRLDSATYYFYALQSVRVAPPVASSPVSDPVVAFTHAPPRIDSARALGDGRIALRVVGRIADRMYRPGAVTVEGTDGIAVVPSSIITDGASTLIVTLPDVHIDTVVVGLSGSFRDLWGTPADTSVLVRVAMPEMESPGARFVATSASPASMTTIVVVLNAAVDSTSIAAASIKVQPDRSIAAIHPSASDPRQLILELDPSRPLGPYGEPYVVTLAGIRDTFGRSLNNGAGSTVGFTITADDLSTVRIFPQPYSLSRDVTVTLGGLTRSATVHILSQSGAPVRDLTTDEGNGGVQWDGRDNHGQAVMPGIYLYVVTGSDGITAVEQSPTGKIAVIP